MADERVRSSGPRQMPAHQFGFRHGNPKSESQARDRERRYQERLKDPSPFVVILEPRDGEAIRTGLLNVRVRCFSSFAHRELPKLGKISVLELLINNVVVAEHDGPARIPRYEFGFLGVDVGRFLNTGVPFEIQVKAYRGRGKRREFGVSDKVRVIADDQSPLISDLDPGHGARLNRRRPSVSSRILDVGGSGLDPQEGATLEYDGYPVMLRVDAVSPQELKVTWEPETDLEEGHHVIVLRAQDRSGNSAKSVARFLLDYTSPVVAELAPASGGFYPAVKAFAGYVTDPGGAGIDKASATAVVDGTVVPCEVLEADHGTKRLEARIDAVLGDGLHRFSLSVLDRAGNRIETGEHPFVITPRTDFLKMAQEYLDSGQLALAKMAIAWSRDAQAPLLLGRLAEKEGNVSEALSHYRSSNRPEVEARVVQILKKTEQWDELLALANRRGAEGDKAALALAGNILARQQKMSEAEQAWKASDTATSHYNLACLECSRGNKEAALNHIRILAGRGGAWLESLTKDPRLTLIQADLPAIPNIITEVKSSIKIFKP